MSNKVSFVTGANRGLGLETARQLGMAGHVVVMGSRDKAKGDGAVKLLRSEGLDVHYVHVDMNDSGSFVGVRDYLLDKYGRLDCLVNNAGTNGGEDFFTNTALDISADRMKAIFQTNFFGAVELTQMLVPLLLVRGGGMVVNVSSILGSLGMHASSASPIYDAKALGYNSSKAALNMFSLHLAHALRGKGVAVYSVHPGWVKTDMGTDAAPMEVTDGARTVVDLVLGRVKLPSGSFVHLGKELPW